MFAIQEKEALAFVVDARRIILWPGDPSDRNKLLKSPLVGENLVLDLFESYTLDRLVQ